MPNAPLPNPTCPLCGEANQCAPAASGSFDTPCWCTNVKMDPDAIARIVQGVVGELKKRGMA